MEIYKLDNLQLFHGDCMQAFGDIDDQSIDFIITDPPYECSTSIITRNNQKDLNSNFGAWDTFFTDWVQCAYRVLKENSGMIIFVPATRFETLMYYCEQAGFKYAQPWFWKKTNPAIAIRSGLQWSVEHMIYVKKGKHILNIENKGRCHNMFEFPTVRKRIHPTEKPVKLLEKIVGYVSNAGNLILDPFSGSGSTAVACLQNNRKFIGFERNDEFFHKSTERLQNLTVDMFA